MSSNANKSDDRKKRVIREKLWEEFMKSKSHLSAAAQNNYKIVWWRFCDYFNENNPIDQLTPEQMLHWKRKMLLSFSPTTVAYTLRSMKSVFRFAVMEGFLPSNPLTKIDCGSLRNPTTQRFVAIDEFKRIFAQCGTWEQRAVLILSRFGGLRSPSEVLNLKWSNIDWKKKSIFVPSLKFRTWKAEGRTIPLFPAVRRVLEDMKIDLGKKKGEFVIESCRDPTKAHFGTWLAKLEKKAGIDRIPRPFDNMRLSRASDLIGKFGLDCANEWMGYSYISNSSLAPVQVALETRFKEATEWDELGE